MDFLQEHNYGAFKTVQVQPDLNNSARISSSDAVQLNLNVKMECNSNYSDDSFENREEDHHQNYETQFLNEVVTTTNHKTEERSDVDSDRSVSSVNRKLSDLEKATIFQTCVSLLDSSSSDDDELILLWLLSQDKKKKLRKRRRFI